MTPLMLIGKNLGERHQYLNKLVQEAYERNEEFSTLQDLPEESSIDRLFKIDLASKIRNTDYIVQNLKDSDMLYVSRALKSKWLLENEKVINPDYLEGQLYPHMITTAVVKMKKMIFVNIKNKQRCQDFYQYYYKTNFGYAIKFLKNCSVDFIREIFPHIMTNISSHDFEILCEKDPEIVKIYFNSLMIDNKMKCQYLKMEQNYFNVLIHLLKTYPEFVLDTVENIFNIYKMKPFSPKATKFIMENQKERFMKKSELYTVYLLDMKSLSNCLNNKEIMDLVLKLARAKFLSWFSYKNVEPLMNNLKPEDKVMFKRKVFVDKDIGNEVTDWPYVLPSPPAITKSAPTIFDDVEHSPYEYSNNIDFRAMLKKRKYCKWSESCIKSKTVLDDLFNEFRVASFGRTLFELRKRISAESSPQNRQYMILVLVSKSGGHEENVCKLMELLINHRNEPCQLRATIVRSLVKRACVWRLSEDTWNLLLEFAKGLGLDGKPSEANCIEGIHALVIRELLINGQCKTETVSSFLKNFSMLTEYSLSTEEICIVSKHLPAMLFTEACNEENICQAVYWINKLLDTLAEYRIPIVTYSNLISKIESLATIDVKATRIILCRLFKAKIARDVLFKVNFAIMQSEDSYLNALRHDSSVILPDELVKLILSSNIQYQKFFSKISIYFNESSGLAKQFLNTLKTEEFQVALAKSITLLIGKDLEHYINSIDSSVVGKNKKYEAAIRTNAHLARPLLNIDLNWSSFGTKAIANKVYNCRDIEVNDYVQKLLENKRTMNLALAIAKRNNCYFKTLSVVSKFKPTKAIKSGLNFLKGEADFKVWYIIKPVIENIELARKSKHYLKKKITDVLCIPMEIRPEYCVSVFKNVCPSESMPLVCHIESLLPNINEEFTKNLLLDYIKYFVPCKNNILYSYDSSKSVFIYNSCLYIRLLVKFLLLCKNEETQNTKLKLIGNVFLDKMEETWGNAKHKYMIMIFLDEVFKALMYNKVFLNSEYISCMPVMEEVLTRMKRIVPIEKYFKKHVHLHLIMLYYKAVQMNLGIIENPNFFYDDENEVQCLLKMVGNTFGRCIASKLKVLKAKYFDSIELLYKESISSFFDKYLERSCNTFIESVIYGLLDQSDGNHILGLYLYKQKYSLLNKKSRENILNRIKDIDDVKMNMFLFGKVL